MQLSSEPTYRCPGENYDISRAVHLGRLSAFYETCRGCPQRADVDGLSLSVRKHLTETAWSEPGPLLQPEGIAGIYGDQLDAPLVRRFTSAFGIWLRDQTAGAGPPTVVLAGDDRPLTSELVAAASEGLRYAGCNLVDLGGATAACLSTCLATTHAAGGVLVGNRPSLLRTASLLLWQAHGKPISAPAPNASTPTESNLLAQLWSQAGQPIVRPERRCGAWQRGGFEREYLAGLAPYFHALRPLNFLLDTNCTPLKRYLRKALVSVACRAYAPAELDEPSAVGMHFRVWIDGNGECLHVQDEQGCDVAADDLLCLLALHLAGQQPEAATVVIERETSDVTIGRLRDAGMRINSCQATRAEMHAAMLASRALIGGGPSGRLWFAEAAPVADALRAIALLLVILSQSDRPLSRVLRGE